MKYVFEILFLLVGALAVWFACKERLKYKIKNLEARLAKDCSDAADALSRAEGARALLALPQFQLPSRKAQGERIDNLKVLHSLARRAGKHCHSTAAMFTRYGSQFAEQGRSQLAQALAAEADCLEAEQIYAWQLMVIAPARGGRSYMKAYHDVSMRLIEKRREAKGVALMAA